MIRKAIFGDDRIVPLDTYSDLQCLLRDMRQRLEQEHDKHARPVRYTDEAEEAYKERLSTWTFDRDLIRDAFHFGEVLKEGRRS